MKHALSIALLAATILTTGAHAQERNADGEFCAPAMELMKKANELFGETVKWTGKNAMGYRFILLTSPKGTWTFLMTDKEPDKDGDVNACIKASDGQGPTDGGI
jgi:hypothetical protein